MLCTFGGFVPLLEKSMLSITSHVCLFIIVQELVDDIGILQGKIVRPMRIVNPEQEEYCGLIQVGADGMSFPPYEMPIFKLVFYNVLDPPSFIIV